MKSFRFLFLGALALFVLGVGTLARAQGEPGQWVGDLYSVDVFPGRLINTRHAVLIDENDEIHMTIPNLLYSATFPIPKEEFDSRFSQPIVWRGGAAYALALGHGNDIDEDGRLISRNFFAKWEDGEWSLLGEFITPAADLIDAIPCDGGRMIVVSSRNDLTGAAGPDRTPFARFFVVEGTTDMRLDSAIDHGQEELRPYMSDPEVFKTAAWAQIVLTDRHATLINPDTGLYWVFSLEKATLTHSGNIFKKVTPEMIARGGFSMAVLCVNPEKAGTVLISAQEEDFFVREDGNWWKEVNELPDKMPGLTQEEYRKIWDFRYREALDKSPFMAWYRLDPETGKVEKLKEHPEGGTWIREDAEGRVLRVWRPMPDGSVKMGWKTFDLSTRLANKTEKTENEKGGDAAPPEGDADGGTQEGEAVSSGGDDVDSAEKTIDKEKQTEVAG